MTGLEMTAFALAAALCIMVFRAFDKRRTSNPSTEAPDGPSIRVVEVSIMPGAVIEKWCDDCNRTHRFVNVYAYEGDDPSKARRIGIAAVPDEYDAQDGGRDA